MSKGGLYLAMAALASVQPPFVSILHAQAPLPATVRQTIQVRDFDFVVQKITTNYAGYDMKVTPERSAELAALTAGLRARAATASDEQFEAILTEWIGFFRDRHTSINRLGTGASSPRPSTVRAVPALTEGQARTRLEALGTRRDPVEGIWRIGDSYRIAVFRSDARATRFDAIVIDATNDSWKPGLVKAELRRDANGTLSVNYRDGSFAEHRLGAELVAGGDYLRTTGDFGGWTRSWPPVSDPDRVAREAPSGELFLKRLSPATLWLRLPDFAPERTGPVRELLRAHAADIASTPNIVIDIRENGGGSDFVYAPVLPLLYTQPTYSIGVELRASADNIALRQKIADELRTESPDTAARIEAQNKLMRERLGSYIQPNPKPFSITRLDAVLPSPKRVVVLIDGAGSSGEQFILNARQSRKVTLMGNRNSAGVLDFANVVSMPTPSGKFQLNWAISRSLRLPEDPVDPGGIAPHVLIPQAERDPVTYARAWLERQAD